MKDVYTAVKSAITGKGIDWNKYKAEKIAFLATSVISLGFNNVFKLIDRIPNEYIRGAVKQASKDILQDSLKQIIRGRQKLKKQAIEAKDEKIQIVKNQCIDYVKDSKINETLDAN